MAYQKVIEPIDYTKKKYNTKQRWVSYYLQSKLVQELLSSGSVLEIGIGSKVVHQYLKNLYQVTTCDISEKLQPDVVGSVDDLSMFHDSQFDLVLCAEVLEHIPFENVVRALSELKRVTKRFAILSLPYWGYTFGFKVKLPLLGYRMLKFKVTGIKRHVFNGEHYWEIGKRGYPLRRIVHMMQSAGFVVSRSFWDLDDPYHYYFILKKE